MFDSLMNADKRRAGIQEIKLDIPALDLDAMDDDALDLMMRAFGVIPSRALRDEVGDCGTAYLPHCQQVFDVNAIARFMVETIRHKRREHFFLRRCVAQVEPPLIIR
ncbi:hypothetical protein [Rugamonas rubra]|uniref:hypothetical protein n=1 Tax=Rugamonas rubra TaxID=758825 RepID=UPI00158292A1|nr:hypothetical protein [Rugamonas rubra]